MAKPQGRGSAEWIVVGVLVAVHCFSLLASAATWTVGGSQGWTIGPNYTTWAASQSYTRGDILFFPYTKNEHDVVEVNAADYDACSGTSAIGTYADGNSNVTLSIIGTHYFLCSYTGHCTAGMKFAVTVGAGAGATPAPAPSTSVGTPAPAPNSTSAPGTSAPTPTSTAPVPSPTSVATPTSAPTPTPTPTPAPTPTPTPTPTSAPTPTPPSSSPSPGTPGSTPPSSGTPSPTGSTPPPPPPPSFAPSLTSSASLAGALLCLSAALLAF